MTKQRVLEGVKVDDAVIISWPVTIPGNKIRSVEYVAKVYKSVLQTRNGLCGVEISTGRAVNAYGDIYVTPATEQDVADVLSEIEARKRADAEYKAKKEADHALALLRGEEKAGE